MGYFTIDQEKTRQNKQHLNEIAQIDTTSIEALQRGSTILQQCVRKLAEQSNALSSNSRHFQHWARRNLDGEFAKLMTHHRSTRPVLIDALNAIKDLTAKSNQCLISTNSMIKNLENARKNVMTDVAQLSKPRLKRSPPRSQSMIVKRDVDMIRQLLNTQGEAQIANLKGQVQACETQIENNMKVL